MESVYFVGIGGIGMSAIARYFLHQGKKVGGYDRTATPLTKELEAEGAQIHYEDNLSLVSAEFLDPANCVVIYTPAIPAQHSELQYFLGGGFEVLKRSQMLGVLTQDKYVMAVAGTHGKSSTSTMVAWLNHAVEGEGCAFLGAISKNFNSNLVLGSGDRIAVEADEFDRSFLRLSPDVAVVTSADADHLDIYGTHEAVKEAFAQFIRQIKSGGSLILKLGVDLVIDNPEIDVWRYAFDEECDFYVSHYELMVGGEYSYDITTPSGVLRDCRLGVPGWVNLENCVAAVASLWCAARKEGRELDFDRVRAALAEFKGIKRRLEVWVNTPHGVYMDDYAHHPRELTATLTSVAEIYPKRKVTAIFQPHLFTRTRDLYEGFAQALSHADEVVLLPIYPAREEPIEGITTEIIAKLLSVPYEIVERECLAEYIASKQTDIVISFGAGDIDTCCEALAEVVAQKVKE